MVTGIYNIWLISIYSGALVFVFVQLYSVGKELNERHFKKKNPFVSWIEDIFFIRLLHALFHPEKYLKEQDIKEGNKLLRIYAVLILFTIILSYLLFSEVII